MSRPDAVREMRRRWPGGRYLPALAGALTVAGALSGVPALAAAHAAVRTCQWRDGAQPAPGTTGGSLASVTALSSTDAWAVGSTGDDQALIEHWNGSAWRIAPIPSLGTSALQSVRAASRTSVWAVGHDLNGKKREQTLILHWNGEAWAQQPSPDPGSALDNLFGVRAVSATNAWAVGEFSNGPNLHSLILHWNGKAWKRVTSPSPAPDSPLAGVAATSTASAWAVGQLESFPEEAPRQPGPATPAGVKKNPRTFIAHWNGRRWSQTASPNPGGFDFLEAVGTTSATNIWAVGTTEQLGTSQTLILHGNGKTFKQVASPDPAGSGAANSLNGVFGSSAGNAWAVGNSRDGSFVLRWDGHRWWTAFGPFGFTELLGVAGSSAGNAWAVGSVSDAGGSMPQPFALHCT